MKRSREDADALERPNPSSNGVAYGFGAKFPPEQKKSGDSPVKFETKDCAPRAPPQASPIRRKSAPLPTFSSTHASDAYKTASKQLRKNPQATIETVESAIASVQSQLPEHLQKSHESLAPLFYLHGVALLTQSQHDRDTIVDEYTDEEREDMDAIKTLLLSEERLQAARTIVTNVLAENEDCENEKYLDKLKLFLHLTEHALAELESIHNIPTEAAEYYMGSLRALESMSNPNLETIATAQFYAAHQFMLVADSIKDLDLEEEEGRPTSAEDVELQAALAASAAEAIAASEDPDDFALQAALAASVADANKGGGEEDMALKAAIAASEAEAIAESAEASVRAILTSSAPQPLLEDGNAPFEYAKSKSLGYYVDCAKTLEQIINHMCGIDDISEFVVTEVGKAADEAASPEKTEEKSAGLKTTGLDDEDDDEDDKDNIEPETTSSHFHQRDVDEITSIMDRVEALAAQILAPDQSGEHAECMYYIGWLEVVQQLAEDILWDKYDTQSSAADLKPTPSNY